MPIRTFEVVVSVRENNVTTAGKSNVIAEASRYLAYADQSDTFGYAGAIDNVMVYEPIEAGPHKMVALTFKVPLAYGSDDSARFMDEMEKLSRVSSFTEVN